ncbi:MAG: InlB B-repeat-containing protein [Spirochaetaceae bacterium]|jgi:uncharacterized repeat protein (TIGR02543 family)|nr:InlB B-repeat-containing protein [Spirochaetaceae bacterium]
MANKKIMRNISAVLSVFAIILLGCPESADDPPVQYTVTFDPAGGTVVTTAVQVNSGKTLSDLPIPTKDGYDFVGWFTQNGSQQGIQFDTVIPITKDITLYARWKTVGTPDPVMYTITFNAGEGAVEPATIKAEAGASLGDHLPAAARSGYTFGGWYTAQNGGGTQFTATTPVTANITVYAKWTTGQTAQYTVTFNPDGGTVSPTTAQVNSGETVGTLPAPAKTGYTFGGWYTAQNGGGTQFTATTPVTANITVYAKWTALPSSSGANALSGKTYVDLDTKIVFSSTASGAVNGTFTKYGQNRQDGGYVYVEIAIGSYAWNGTAKTVTLVPEKVAEQLNGDEYGPLQTKTEYRASAQVAYDQAIAQQGAEAVNQMIATMGFSSVAEYVDYVVEGAFKNVIYNYAFSADNKALFLDEPLPDNVGINELAGQTYNGVSGGVKNLNRTYVFTTDSCTFTNSGSPAKTYRYAYNSSRKLVFLKIPTDGRDAAYTAVASNTTDSGGFSSPDEYNAAKVNDQYNKLYSLDYNTAEKTISD